MPADQKQQMKQILDTYESIVKAAIWPVVVVAGVVALVTIVGSLQMRNLKGRGLAYTGAILSMIPCVSGCCLLGIPFGIWAIIALGKPDVKAGFAATQGSPPDRLD
jgi:hypothetical protein